MQKQPRTIYQIARLHSGFTQETASELLMVSTESIRAYESGRTVPPPEIVVSMAKTYRAPWLSYLHLTTIDPVGKSCLPNIEIRDLSTSVLMLQKEMEDVSNARGDMIEVTCDGEIGHHEKTKWENVTSEIKHLIAAGLTVLLAPHQKEKPPVLAHRRS